MNWDKIEQLLRIAEGSLLWPKLKPIHDAAMEELEKHSSGKVNEQWEVKKPESLEFVPMPKLPINSGPKTDRPEPEGGYPANVGEPIKRRDLDV